VRIDERIARCLTHLRASEFDHFREYLRAKRQGALEKMAITQDEKMIFKLQGEASMLAELLDNIEGAEALLAKLKQNSRP
jgi:hypothetical protein